MATPTAHATCSIEMAPPTPHHCGRKCHHQHLTLLDLEGISTPPAAEDIAPRRRRHCPTATPSVPWPHLPHMQRAQSRCHHRQGRALEHHQAQHLWLWRETSPPTPHGRGGRRHQGHLKVVPLSTTKHDTSWSWREISPLTPHCSGGRHHQGHLKVVPLSTTKHETSWS
jgi:hypothetical protein